LHCLLDKFQPRGAGGTQYNQFQALLALRKSVRVAIGVTLHIGYR